MKGLECAFQGRISRDPTVRYTQAGQPIVGFGVGVDDPDSTEERAVVWVNVSWFGDDAAAQADDLAKGASVYVEGVVRPPRVYQDKQGETRASLDVTARRVQLIGMVGRHRDPTQKPPVSGAMGANLAPDAVPW